MHGIKTLEYLAKVDVAKNRMIHYGLFDEYEECLFYDWNEGTDHIDWLITAPIDEIESWCIAVG
tara:strand:+ start:1082 stop:1273 length:192 start_codon:yes stop_codon:yes gene_type:complete